MITFDHAAIATSEPEKLKKVLKLLGLTDEGTELVESQGVNTHFLRPKPSHPSVEILEVVDPQGTVAKYLAKKGSGIHHLAFRVDEIEKVCETLKAQAIRLVYATPQPGAHKTRVNFIHPESTGGILIELTSAAK